jgi:hypothetical protein
MKNQMKKLSSEMVEAIPAICIEETEGCCEAKAAEECGADCAVC